MRAAMIHRLLSHDLLPGYTGDTEVSLRIVMARCKT
jgi:hypothetical protein